MTRVMTKVFAIAAVVICIGTFVTMLIGLINSGYQSLSFEFLFSSPRNFGLEGGIAPILISTSMILVLAILFAVPISMLTAIFLFFRCRCDTVQTRLILTVLELLASIPSIVFGLFGMLFFCDFLHLGFSILSGGLTLALMIFPTLCLTLFASFLTLPNETRMVSESLGLSRLTVARHLLIPHSISGIVAGIVLGVCRCLAETAALIFTSGYSIRQPRSIFDSGRSLSVHIYELAMNVAGGDANASAAALVLLIVLLIINLLIFAIVDRQPNWIRSANH